MKKLLLTLTQRNNRMFTFLFFLFSFVLIDGMQAQALPYGALTQCDCSPGMGQFRAKIFVQSHPSENWNLIVSDGFFDIGSPLSPYPLNTPLIEQADSTYTLDGIHYPDYIWSVMASNGTDTVDIVASVTCTYPDSIIQGDKDVCLDDVEDYWINEPTGNIAGALTWSLSGGGVLTQLGNIATVEWNNSIGIYTLSVSGVSIWGCPITEVVTITKRDNTPIALACNNLVNISMNTLCEVMVTPDMILEDMALPSDAYDIVLRHVSVDTIVPNGIINGKYIGIPLEVSVIHECSGNSCWSTINIEDKDVPNLICVQPDTLECDETILANLNSLPIPDSVTAILNATGGFTLFGFDGCGEAYLTYIDEVVSEGLCTGPFSSIINRHWTVTDESGSTNSCTTVVSIKRASLADITFPGHWDDVLGPDSTIQACSTFPKVLETGHPHPSYTGEPEGIHCLDVNVSYEDVKIPICGEYSFKIVRKWKVIDICSNTILTNSQNITVMDNEPPVCTAPPEYSVTTTANSCGSIVDVKPPSVIFECSDWDYYISYKIRDEDGEPYLNPTTDDVIGSKEDGYTILNIAPGQDSIWIVYNIFDECGNFTQCFTEVGFIDEEQPVPVCDLHTFIALNEDGFACVGANTFDDGSWDNCGIARIEVERMDGDPCGIDCPDGMISFCCDDIGEIIMVRMTVWDHSGNSNFCMVEAEVQDNIAPVFTSCPGPVNVDCSKLPLTYYQYGVATAEDGCDVTITEEYEEDINDCGVGEIIRTFTATDKHGNAVSCEQIISVIATIPFTKGDITFPGSYTFLNGCSDTGTEPDDLPNGFQKPKLTFRACSQVAVTYEDQVFQFVDEACFKILRTWTVIDWCQYVPLPYTPPYDVLGKWTSEQVIKVMNSTAPTITKGCDDIPLYATPDANCQMTIDLSAEANDDCTSITNLVWSYSIDLGNNGSIDRTGTDNDASGLFPSGIHKVTWNVSDDCGNETTCMQIVTVHDDKNPTPYCYSGIVSVMPEEGVLAIWASDFDKGSFDNCPEDGNVIVAFSSDPNDNSIVFTCADMTGMSDTFDIQMYVIDDEGNFDYCDTKFIIQDNADVCPDVEIENPNEGDTLFSLAGHIYTANDEMLNDVDVMLVTGSSETTSHDMTEDGSFAFHNLSMHSDFMVEPSKEGNYMDGISTLDLILIQRHILKLKKFNSPYKIIAADIDNSGKITAIDLIQLRKLILGKYDKYPSNSSWRFVDADEVFEDEKSPFPFLEDIAYNNLENNAMNTDFIAVKIGDVNHSLNFTESSDSESRNSNIFNFEYSSENNDGLLSMNIYSTMASVNLEGLQTTMTFDASKYRFIGVKAGDILLTKQNINLDLAERGVITISYNEDVYLEETANVLFNLEFESKETSINEISFNSEKIKSELYISKNDKIETFDLTLNPKGTDLRESGFELYYNVPNPFVDKTSIQFHLDKADEVTINVFDLTGKIVYHKVERYNAGMNTKDIEAKDIDASGVLYYQLETAVGTLGNKMIIIK